MADMNALELKSTVDTLRHLRQRYVESKEPIPASELTRLTRMIGRHLAFQRMDELSAIADELGPLVQAADAFGNERPGARWRALGEIAALFSGHPQVLELQRWMNSESLKGKILRHILSNEGVSVGALAEALEKSVPHISNELMRLEGAGLIARVTTGRQRHLFLSRRTRTDLAALLDSEAKQAEEAARKAEAKVTSALTKTWRDIEELVRRQTAAAQPRDIVSAAIESLLAPENESESSPKLRMLSDRRKPVPREVKTFVCDRGGRASFTKDVLAFYSRSSEVAKTRRPAAPNFVIRHAVTGAYFVGQWLGQSTPAQPEKRTLTSWGAKTSSPLSTETETWALRRAVEL